MAYRRFLNWSLGLGACAMLVSSGVRAEDSDQPINGVEVKALKDLTKALKDNPKAGQTTFFSSTKWQDGMKSATSIQGYMVDGQMKKQHERIFMLQGDEAAEIGGTDTAPGAVEEMMYAVGTCIVAAANANAALSGVKLTKMEVDLQSDIDMHGLLALDPNVRPGLLQLRTKITIAGDADEATLKKIAMFGYNFSPVSDTVRHGVTNAVVPDIVVEGAK